MNNRKKKTIRYNSRYEKKRKERLQKRMIAVGISIVTIAVVVLLLVTFGNKNQKSVQDEKKDSIETAAETVKETKKETETEKEAQSETETEKEAQPKKEKIESTNGKTLYLTFDDGPSENTDAILEILDQYGVPATFFVLAIDGEEARYKDIIDRGHEIGVHSTSHDYDTVYADLDSFIEDVSSCRNFVETITGHKLFLYRFPGGTNNQVHNVSISSCIEYLESVGLKHFDWNVSSGDAAGVMVDKEEIKNNIFEQVRGNADETMVVLMHDSSAKTTTVEALREYLPVLIDEGFGFSKITPDTPEITFSPFD